MWQNATNVDCKGAQAAGARASPSSFPLAVSHLSFFPVRIKPGWRHRGQHRGRAARLQRPASSNRAFFGSLILHWERCQTDSPGDNLSFAGQLRNRQQNVAFQVISFLASGLFLSCGMCVRPAELSMSPSPPPHWIKLLGRHFARAQPAPFSFHPRAATLGPFPLPLPGAEAAGSDSATVLPLLLPLPPRFWSSDHSFHTPRANSPQSLGSESSLPLAGIGHARPSRTWGSPRKACFSPVACSHC